MCFFMTSFLISFNVVLFFIDGVGWGVAVWGQARCC